MSDNVPEETCKKCGKVMGCRIIYPKYRWMQARDQMLYRCECGFAMLMQMLEPTDRIHSHNQTG